MPVRIHHGSSDEVIDQIITALAAYEVDHPEAAIDIYRQNSVSVRIRVVDPAFESCGRSERHEEIWKYLDRLPEDVLSEISMLVPLSPTELDESFANIEFENPLPSRL
jgi:hypothetical protein